MLGFVLPTSTNSPLLSPTLSSIVAIACGNGHSMALTANGTLFTFGSNANGQVCLLETRVYIFRLAMVLQVVLRCPMHWNQVWHLVAIELCKLVQEIRLVWHWRAMVPCMCGAAIWMAVRTCILFVFNVLGLVKGTRYFFTHYVGNWGSTTKHNCNPNSECTVSFQDCAHFCWIFCCTCIG